MDIQLKKFELIKLLADVEDKTVIKQMEAILMPKKSIAKDRPYKPSMVRKIKQGKQDIKDGKGTKIEIKDLWK